MKFQTLTLAAAGLVTAGAITAGATAQIAGDAANPAAGSVQTVKPGDVDGAFVMGNKFSEPTGEKLYRRVCAACHMPDGGGAVGAGYYPSLRKNPKFAAGSYPLFVVMKGLNGMPPLGEMMTDAQAADVVNYVRSHFGNTYKDKVSAADAAALR